MLLSIYSYNGTQINDGTNYAAWFPTGEPAGPSASPKYSARTRTFPKLSYKDIGAVTLSFHIETKGTIHSQLDTLRALFAINDYTPRNLIVKDTNDSNRQWYIKGYPIGPLRPVAEGAGEYVVTLAIDEPLWRTVTPNSASWTVTSSPGSKSLTLLGNWPARPKFTMTLTSAKTSGGYLKKWWKPWYNPLSVANNEPMDWTNGGWNTAALIADTTVSNQINQVGGITAVATSFPIDTNVGGGLSAGGGMCYVDSEQIYYTGISAGVMTVYDNGAGVTGRGWGGTTAAIHADNAVLKRSSMMANGQDLRLFNGDTEIPRWLDGINTSSTKIWCTPKFDALVSMTLNTPISNVGTPTTITVKQTAANLAALKKLPNNFMVSIDSELFYCENPVPSSYYFSVTARAQRSTAAASHSSGATIIFLQHDLTVAYNYPLAAAVDQDESAKPIFDLSSSTNTSLVYATLSNNDGLRVGSWKKGINKRSSPATDGNSRIYTATQNTLADPATDLGFAAKSFSKNGKYTAESFIGFISLYHPAGFTTVTMTGYKRKDGSKVTWPSVKFQKSTDGTNWSDVWTEAAPGSLASWLSLDSHSAVSLSGTYQYVRLYMNASIAAAAGNAAYTEFGAATLVVNSSYVPQLAFSTSAVDNYHIDGVLACTETGESIRIVGTATTGSVIVVNCDTNTITLDGKESNIGITWNTERNDWLNLPSPKQSATCTLTWTETGVTNMGVAIAWDDRAAI
jgi:hypothetical protein